jgi:heme oxygenase
VITSPALERLRADTRQHHLRVEERLDLTGSCATLDGYRQLLARMLGLYVPLEARLSGLDWAGTGVDLDERLKISA